MSETLTYGSVGGPVGNHWFYPEADSLTLAAELLSLGFGEAETGLLLERTCSR